jgi:hypothetical protein
MKEHPILFSGPMIRAIIDDKKTVTRRLMKPQPAYVWGWGVTRSDPEHFSAHVRYPGGHQPDPWARCPYGKAGDRLWVRETWAVDAPLDQVRREREDVLSGIGHGPYYRADKVHENTGLTWRPSIFMPRWASRLLLENVAVRVERLQDISDADILAEGFPEDPPSYAEGFAAKWNEINPKYPWESNPWVWVVEFKRIEASI